MNFGSSWNMHIFKTCKSMYKNWSVLSLSLFVLLVIGISVKFGKLWMKRLMGRLEILSIGLCACASSFSSTIITEHTHTYTRKTIDYIKKEIYEKSALSKYDFLNVLSFTNVSDSNFFQIPSLRSLSIINLPVFGMDRFVSRSFQSLCSAQLQMVALLLPMPSYCSKL